MISEEAIAFRRHTFFPLFFRCWFIIGLELCSVAALLSGSRWWERDSHVALCSPGSGRGTNTELYQAAARLVPALAPARRSGASLPRICPLGLA